MYKIKKIKKINKYIEFKVEGYFMYVMLRKMLAIVFVGLMMATVTIPAQAQEQVFETISKAESEAVEVALEGYDVVSYFYSSAPQKGNKTYQAVYQGKRYLFTSSENQEKFATDPEQYLPEFEEYCGCAASESKLVKADPTVFKVMKGKLVLFENKKALSKWNKDEEERYKKAQNFWKYESEYNASDRIHEDTRVRLFTF